MFASVCLVLFCALAAANARPGKPGNSQSSSGSDSARTKPGVGGTLKFDYVVVGQGVGGIATEYFLAQALRDAGVDASEVSIGAFEARDAVGGNVRAVPLVEPANYDGSFGDVLYADQGPQRTTQLSLGMKRRMLAELNITMLYTPFKGEHNSRGLRLVCGDPTVRALAERAAAGDTASAPALSDLAFAYGSLCSQDEYYVGDVNSVDTAPFPGLHNPAVGTNDAPSDNAFFWLLDGAPFEIVADEPDLGTAGASSYDFQEGGEGFESPNPMTGRVCRVADNDCPFQQIAAAGDDWPSHIARQMAFAAAPLNYNYTKFMEHDNVGFLGDFRKQYGAASYTDWVLREWGTTNGINGYIPGGERRLALAMHRNATANGVRTFVDERVVRIDRGPGSKYAYRLVTTKRRVLVRKFLFLNLPPYYLFKEEAASGTRWEGKRIGGKVIDELRAVRALQHPDPQETVRIMAQWPPGKRAWFWDLFDNVNGNHSYRQLGDTGCFSRTEFIDTPYHRCTNHMVPVYTDDACERLWLGYAREMRETNDDARFAQRVVDEMRSSFPDLADKIDAPVKVAFEYFPSAWHWGRRTRDDVSNAEVTRVAAAPLGPAEPLAVVGEAYCTSFSGWEEGAFRTAKRALLTRVAGDVPQLTTRFNDLFDVFRDKSTGFGVSDGSWTSNFAYTPPLYANPDPEFMLANEYWWPYGPFTPGFNYCSAASYGLPAVEDQ